MEEEVEEEEELEDEKEEEEEDIKLLQREIHSRRAALRKRWSKWENNITLLQRSPPNFQWVSSHKAEKRKSPGVKRQQDVEEHLKKFLHRRPTAWERCSTWAPGKCGRCPQRLPVEAAERWKKDRETPTSWQSAAGILKTLLTQVRKQVKVRHREESEYKTEQVHSCTCGKV